MVELPPVILLKCGRGVFLEELIAVVITHLLTCIEKRHARHNVCEGCKGLYAVTKALKLCAIPSVAVMVGYVVHLI